MSGVVTVACESRVVYIIIIHKSIVSKPIVSIVLAAVAFATFVLSFVIIYC